MSHLLGVRTATAVASHVSARRQSWLPALLPATAGAGRSLALLAAELADRRPPLALDAEALARRVERAGSAVPAPARQAFLLFAEDLAEAAPRLRLWTRLATHIGLSLHLQSHRVLQEDVARQPSLASSPLRPPLFVVGLPRTGTTLLHHLLALDPDSQCLRAYELMRPVRSSCGLLPVGIVDFLDWARLALLLRVISFFVPQWLHHHDLDAGSPEECLFALQRSLPLDTHYRARPSLLRSYSARAEIPEDAYARYRLFLQQTQVRRGSCHQRYVLKGQLLHLQFLGPLQQAFPEARFVWTHRPPEQVVGSLCSLRRSQQEIFTHEAADLEEVGHGVLEYLSGALNEAAEALERRGLGAEGADDDPLVHVSYGALVEDPIRTVEELYASWGWKVSPAHREAMERYLERSARVRQGRSKERAHYHDASLQRYGLSPEAVARHFAAAGCRGLDGLGGAFVGGCAVLRHGDWTRRGAEVR